MASDLTVFVVEDDVVVREYLVGTLKSANYRVSIFSSGEEILEAYEPLWAGCVIMDMGLPGISGIETMRKLTERGSILPVIVLTGTAVVSTAVEVMRLGAVDLLEKPCADTDLLARVDHGFQLYSQRHEQRTAHDRAHGRWAKLTEREQQTALLVVQGLANKQIAAQMNVSEKTVEAHRGKVMHKMEVESIADLVREVIAARV